MNEIVVFNEMSKLPFSVSPRNLMDDYNKVCLLRLVRNILLLYSKLVDNVLLLDKMLVYLFAI